MDKISRNLTSVEIEITEDEDRFEAVNDLFEARGWSDGLPLVPPTPSRVRRMLDVSGLDGSRVLGVVPSARGIATVEKVAINAVMAGCRPEYLPVVVASVEAALDPTFNLNGIQSTTHSVCPLTIVGGPVRKQIGMNWSHNVFGQGNRANATIGRALRLVMITLGGTIPGVIDKAVHGHPGKYTYCIAEDQENSPWGSLHTTMGLPEECSAVTMFGCEAPHGVLIGFTQGPGGILRAVASVMSALGNNNIHYKGQCLIVLGPESARFIAAAGWSLADVKQYLYERARFRIDDYRRTAYHDYGYWKDHWPKSVDHDRDEYAPVVSSPDEIKVVVTGAEGKFCLVLPGWGRLGGQPVVRQVMTN